MATAIATSPTAPSAHLRARVCRNAARCFASSDPLSSTSAPCRSQARGLSSPSMAVRQNPLDRLLYPIHAWVWRDAERRGHKLLRFSLTEADGGRDLSRAAELTKDALLRRLYLRHAIDEQRHAGLFRQRGHAILAALPAASVAPTFQANAFAPGERGLDDLEVDRERDDSLLAF